MVTRAVGRGRSEPGGKQRGGRAGRKGDGGDGGERPWGKRQASGSLQLVHDEGLEGSLAEEEAFEGVELAADLVAEGGALAGEIGGEGSIHAAFVGGEKAATALQVQVDAALAGLEVIFGVEGAVVEQVEGKAVGDGGAEGLDEVKGEGRAAGLGFVEVAEGGVQAGGVERGGGLVGEQGVAEGEEGVGGIVGRAMSLSASVSAVSSKGSSTSRWLLTRRARVPGVVR